MNFNIVNIAFTVLITIACLMLVYILGFTKGLPHIQGSKRTILIIILLAYSAFRGFRIYRGLKK